MVKQCIICNEEFVGYGHNPAPIREEGRACDDCNFRFVVRARILELQNYG